MIDYSFPCQAGQLGFNLIFLMRSYAARNPGQRWRTEFDGRGFLVRPDRGKWTWGMELQTDQGDDPKVGVAGHKLSDHWIGIDEWFLNDRRGLRQGGTIHAGTAGSLPNVSSGEGVERAMRLSPSRSMMQRPFIRSPSR